MRATNVMRFVIFGAVGFGIGGAIVGSMLNSWLFLLLFPFVYFILGMLGGASLGLALGDRKPQMKLAVVGGAGFCVGGLFAVLGIELILSMPYYLGGGLPNNPFFAFGFLGAVSGAVGGAALGWTFKDRRSVLTLAVAGCVGFGFGNALANGILTLFMEEAVWGAFGGAIGGIIGGATLGAALGHLEKRKLNKSEDQESDEPVRWSG